MTTTFMKLEKANAVVEAGKASMDMLCLPLSRPGFFSTQSDQRPGLCLESYGPS
ncbi:hypothetical protein F2Q69_00002708 [Brassica cretica]|uniref:Uncharacterized protein n=2 Tax=Brassica cretica TaxID=69181 RepID=A0A8S9P8N9_BRACR|nr:hypothetical protein F2Q69_00002708 [Brassica cretica]KAF3550017.1 hypothetical protein DY000_02003155 [Brassica cretica]